MRYSAIIVLGNLMSREGQLNSESAFRMDIAINAFHKRQANYIITCGWAYRDDSSIAIADAMKQYGIESGGIPRDAILTEKNSRDTVGDAVFTKRNIIQERGWERILVATSDYHVSRTREIFTHIYGEQYIIEIVGASTERTEVQSQSERQSISAFRETFRGTEAGNDAEIYKRLCGQHPFYNGRVHPKIADAK